MEPMQKISGVGAGGKEEREELGAVAVAEALIKSSCKATYSWAFQIHEAIIFFFFKSKLRLAFPKTLYLKDT